jgi:hypothetical protein
MEEVWKKTEVLVDWPPLVSLEVNEFARAAIRKGRVASYAAWNARANLRG